MLGLGRKRADRIRREFQDTFETKSGQFVLMWMYEHWYGKQSTWPKDGDVEAQKRNEGTRIAWLQVMEQLKEEDIEVRRKYETYLANQRKEAMNE